ncbi:hypothetical protein RHS03_05823, partial [Rhizoctonia solani]
MIAATASLRLGELSDSISSLDPAQIVEQVNVTTLESILKMAEDVDTYQYFKSQRLIGGCIALMQKIKVEEKSSGSAELRVRRIMQQNTRQTPGIECPLVLSSHVAQIVRQEIHAASQGLECDSMLGWGTSEDHPLASDEHVKALVQMLRDDRANLLRVLSSAYSPAISGLSFLLWRYIYLDAQRRFRDGSERGSPDIPLIKRIMEIHFGCALVVTSDQGEPMLSIADELCELLGITPGEGDRLFPRSPDPDDSRMIFEAYVSRLAPPDTRIYAPVSVMLAIILPELVVANMRPGLEGLLSTVFQVTVERFWNAWNQREELETMLIGSTGMMFEHIKSLLQPTLRTSVLSPSVQKDILEAFVKGDLADLAGSVLFALNANAIENTPDSDTNYNLMKTIQTTFDTIGTTHTAAILEKCFRDYAPDWIKVQRPFVVCGMCMDLHTDRDRTVTTTPSAALRLKDQIARVRRAWNGCVFLRCQDPIGIDRRGVAYACSECKALSYCSVRCQAGDWDIGGERDPHRHTCQQLSQVFDPAHASDPLSFAHLLNFLNPQ